MDSMNNTPTVDRIFEEEIDGERRIIVRFRYNKETTSKIKAIRGARWHPWHRAWHVPSSGENLLEISRIFDVGDTSLHDSPGGERQDRTGGKRLRNMGRRKVRAIRTRDNELRVTYSYELQFNAFLRDLPESRFDRVYRWWSLPDTQENRDLIRAYCYGQDWTYTLVDDRNRKRPV